MNKGILLFVLLFSLSDIIYSIDRKTYSFTFNKDEFDIVENDGIVEINSLSMNYYNMDKDNNSAMPYRSLRLLIPPCAKITNINIKKNDITILSDVLINSNMTTINKEDSILIITSPYNIYNESDNEDLFSDNYIRFTGVHALNGFRFAEFIITPFLYKTEEKELKMITELLISFDITIDSTNTNIYPQRAAISMIKGLVDNPEDIEEIYCDYFSVDRTSSNDIDYLIVTSEQLVNSFKPLIDWKRQKGLKAEIVSLTSILSDFQWVSTTDIPLVIKTFLWYKYHYQNVKWVLLGGDESIIPVRGCYGKYYENNTINIKTDIPCDLYYASLDTSLDSISWDLDNDGIYGEREDYASLYSSIFLSRLPVYTSSQVSSYVNKCIAYEQTPDTTIVNKMLLSGIKTGTEAMSSQLSDAQKKSQNMYDNRINVLNSEWHGSLTRFFDTYTDISNDNTYDVTYSNLVDQLNNGYHIVHVSTHGYGYNNNAWCMETGLPFNSSHALLLYNNLPSVILTDACNQNAFDWPSDPCLSESFIRNSEGGAIVFWGSSREGFSNPGNSISLSFKYNSDFLENLYCYSDVDNSYKARFGFYTTLVKNNLAPSINISDKMRFLQFSINAIGDPEVPIYTDKPYEFTNVSISYSGSNITVNTGGVQNCTIALTSIDPADEYFAVFENVSTATFNDVLCPYNLVITKHNYIPYRNCQQDVYIQNVVFDSNVHVKGRNIYVGRSVIPSSLEGNVFVNPGNSVIFEAEQNVYIKDGFILGAGSTFEIK